MGWVNQDTLDDDQVDQHDHSEKALDYFKTVTVKILHVFVILRSMKWFQIVEPLRDFLDIDTDVWHDWIDYKHSRKAEESLNIRLIVM